MPNGPRTERNPGHEEPTGIMETTVTNRHRDKGAFAESMCGGVIYYTPDITKKKPDWREVFDDTTAAKHVNPNVTAGAGCDGGGWLQTSQDDHYLYHAVIGRNAGSLSPDDTGSPKMVYVLDVHKLIASSEHPGCKIDNIREVYGIPRTAPHGHPIAELILTVLSQSTNDRNRDVAYLALRERWYEWTAIRDAPVDEIEEAIRPGGISKVKSARIKSILQAITDTAPGGELSLDWLTDLSVPEARHYLTQLPGVGRKTAACVLLFGSHVPALPVDTHVHRVSLRLGLVSPRTSPEATADALEAALDPRQYYAFHLNLIRLGREICKAPRPRCEVCPLHQLCATYATARAITDRAVADRTSDPK